MGSLLRVVPFSYIMNVVVNLKLNPKEAIALLCHLEKHPSKDPPVDQVRLRLRALASAALQEKETDVFHSWEKKAQGKIDELSHLNQAVESSKREILTMEDEKE